MLYKLHDSSDEEFGVLTNGGQRKQSFSALAGVFASPFGTPAPVTLKLRRTHGKVIASGSAPVGDFMEVEVFKRGAPAYRSIFTLNRFNEYSTHAPEQSRHASAAGARTGSTARAPAARRSAGSERGARLAAAYSAPRASASTVSRRIFRSRPSDQWAM